jgi:hypothetical protein
VNAIDRAGFDAVVVLSAGISDYVCHIVNNQCNPTATAD